jgi:hypothetical protein
MTMDARQAKACCQMTSHGRLVLVEWVATGRPIALAAKEMGTSWQCAPLGAPVLRQGGVAGLADRSSQPHCMLT